MGGVDEVIIPGMQTGPRRALRVIDLTDQAACLTSRMRWRGALGLTVIAAVLGATSELARMAMHESDANFAGARIFLMLGAIAGALWLAARRPGMNALSSFAVMMSCAGALGFVVFGIWAALEFYNAQEFESAVQLVILSAIFGAALWNAWKLRTAVRQCLQSPDVTVADSLPSSIPRPPIFARIGVAPVPDRWKFAACAIGALILGGLGVVIWISPDFKTGASFRDQRSAGDLAIFLALGAYVAWRRGLRILARSAALLLQDDRRPPLLLLRAWAADEAMIEGGPALVRFSNKTFRGTGGTRLEEVVADELYALGPVRAIGRPGEALPELGAIREYVADDEWKLRVFSLMRDARAIILVIGQDASAGVHWETSLINATGMADKTLLIFPPPPAAKTENWLRRLFSRPKSAPPQPAGGDVAARSAQRTREILGVTKWDIGTIIPMVAMRGAGGDSLLASIGAKTKPTEEAYRLALATMIAYGGNPRLNTS